MAGDALLFVVASTLMMLAMLAILYRNFIFQDRLAIAHGAVPVRGKGDLCLDARDIVSVRLLPASALTASELKMAWLGLGQGQIEIDTASHRYRFGAGLDMVRAEAAMERITAFCQADCASSAAMLSS